MTSSLLPDWRMSDRRAMSGCFEPAGRDEAERAVRLKDPEKAQDFLHARQLMRELAGDALGQPPETISLHVYDDARPSLEGQPSMGLSWSRSGPLALAAFCPDGRIGADIERMRPVQYAPMLDMIATSTESALVLDAAGEDEALRRFYRLWCAKEAVLKWRGAGLKGAAKTVIVPADFIAGEARIAEMSEAEGPVKVQLLDTPEECVAVLALSQQRQN